MNESIASRRGFLAGLLASPVALVVAACARSADQAAPPQKSATVVIENFSAAGKSLGKASVPRVVKSEDEWRALLSETALYVTRHEGTERPFSGEYDGHHADGLYRCVCCDTALFDSRHKFDSGTGWPSFWKPISNANVSEIADSSLLMVRTAVECKRCDAHLGHVFDDGPEPTGLRYCMNSVALRFVGRA